MLPKPALKITFELLDAVVVAISIVCNEDSMKFILSFGEAFPLKILAVVGQVIFPLILRVVNAPPAEVEFIFRIAGPAKSTFPSTEKVELLDDDAVEILV